MKENVISLLRKYLNNECAEEELNLVIELIKNGDYQEEWEFVLSEDSNHITETDTLEESRTNTAFISLHDRIQDSISKQPQRSANIRSINRLSIAVAASILLLGSIFVYLFVLQKNVSTTQSAAVDQLIIPGKTGATLTLDNGEQIALYDSLSKEITQQIGIHISTTDSGTLVYESIDNPNTKLSHHTLSTAQGEKIKIRLADGTVIFLNASSSLKYPTSFSNADKREVILTGEGYFEVTKSKSKPFIVHAQDQTIEVLGTAFNVDAYEANSTVTSLVNGIVKVQYDQQSVVLKPGEESTHIDGKLMVNPMNIKSRIAWKDDRFVFYDEPFESIAKKLERWYAAEFIFDNSTLSIKNKRFSGSLNRSSSIETMLNLFESTGEVDFIIKERRIHVKHP